MDDYLLFSGRANPKLAQDVANYLQVDLSKIEIRDFADGEISVEIKENVRGRKVFILQPTCPPNVSHCLVELLLAVDAFKRASASEINAVVPYVGYGRGDHKDKPRVPISAKLIANLLVAAGIDRLVSIDLHSDQIQGFLDLPFDNLYASYALLPYLEKRRIEDLMIFSPDVGGAKRAQAYAERLGVDFGIVQKKRVQKRRKRIKVMKVIGEPEGMNIVLVDDLVDSAGTLVEAAEALIERGANSVAAACTHAVLTRRALARIERSSLTNLIVTDTIPLRKSSPKMTVLSVAQLLGEAIRRINNCESISSLFL